MILLHGAFRTQCVLTEKVYCSRYMPRLYSQRTYGVYAYFITKNVVPVSMLRKDSTVCKW